MKSLTDQQIAPVRTFHGIDTNNGNQAWNRVSEPAAISERLRKRLARRSYQAAGLEKLCTHKAGAQPSKPRSVEPGFEDGYIRMSAMLGVDGR